MGEAGEVVCLEACLGGHGEGKGLNAGGGRGRCTICKLRAHQEGVGRLIEVYRMRSALAWEDRET